MFVSLNPWYYCNFRCDFCYLTEQQLSDQKKISFEKLDKLLSNIPNIEHIDLYGGEIGALKKDYFYGLRDTIRKHYKQKINIITNFSMLHDGFFEDDFYLSVSYDFAAREKHEKVFMNMMQSPVPIAVLILASPEVMNMSVSYMVNMLNSCRSIESVEIKPYSINQANNFKTTHKDFEEFVIKWLECDVEKKFDFINEQKIIESLNGEYNAFSDDHIYITPNGKYGVLEFDLNDREYFLELENWQEYIDWTNKEKTSISQICRSCRHFGHCLTEHYRYVKDLDNSCNGYKGLLDYYASL